MLGLSRLVNKFQERLDVSRRNAVLRVIGFVSLSVCFVAMIFALSYIISLYTYNFKEEIPLLSGEHIQVKFLNGDVSVDKEKFTELMKKGEGKFSNEIFVCLDGERIVYMTKVAGLKYIYEHIVPVSHNLFLLPSEDYLIRFQRIQDGFVVREIKLDMVGITLFLMSALVVSVLLFMSIVLIQRKFTPSGEFDIKIWI